MDNENEKKDQNVSNPDDFNPVNPVKKKKKLSPVNGLLLALLIVFLIVIIGLLIRMEIAGDGDYFYPFKKMFGIETKAEKELEKEAKTSKKTTVETIERLSLLSEEVNKIGVTHYSIEVDIADLVEFYLENMSNITLPIDDENYYNESDEEEYLDEDWSYVGTEEDDDSWYYDEDEEDNDGWYYDDDEDDDIDYEEIMNCLTGSVIIDLYVKDDKIIQVVLGFDYMELIENLYDAGITPSEDDEDGFESAEEYAEYINSTLKLSLTKSYIAENILSELEDSDINVNLTEKDIKEMIDLVREPGLFELYFNPTDEINEELENYIEENADELEEEDIDPDDFFASMLEYAQDELDEEGYDFLSITVDD